MNMIKKEGGSPRAAVVVADFYKEVADGLLSRCEAVLHEEGAEVWVLRVAGALEIPYALMAYCQTEEWNKRRKPDLMVALGCVIRGETYHFEVVANTSARGILEAQIRNRVPVGNGVLTVDTMEQAMARLDKGADAARAAMRLARLRAVKSAK